MRTRTVGACASQFAPGNPHGDVKTGLALEAQRLKREKIIRASHQRIGIAAKPPPRHRWSHPVATREIAGADPMHRREHRPSQHRFLGKADIDARAMQNSLIAGLRPCGRCEHDEPTM